ncbi:acyltransferase [Afipia carboxidovorans]|uniref:acyltransferase n=1 Tax=Afipia carboxidovorans TaxID=40137 RepID=UPI00309160E1|nr:dTDP-4-amino-4,6-dideoxy-D-glucose acetyltransferase VioB [Afipia carboxidovorans]
MKMLGGQYLQRENLLELGIKRVGENVRIHPTAILVDLEHIELGSHVRIDAYTVISASSGSFVTGDYVHISSHCMIAAGHSVNLCDFSGLSSGVKIFSTSDDYSGESLTNPTIPKHLLRIKSGKVVLGRHAIVGAGSIILPECDVGEGCAVGALSIVTRSLPSWGIYAGIPARRIRDRSRRLLNDESLLQKTPDC